MVKSLIIFDALRGEIVMWWRVVCRWEAMGSRILDGNNVAGEGRDGVGEWLWEYWIVVIWTPKL